MPFTNGISAWTLDGRVTASHDHVGVMVRVDGDRDKPDHLPGAWDCMTGKLDPEMQAIAVKQTAYWLEQGKDVVLRLVGWRGPAKENVTQHGLYTWDGNPQRTGEAFCKFLAQFLEPFAQFPRERLRIEPFSEMGFMPDCTADRDEANKAWWRAIWPIFRTVQSILPGVEVIVGTPSYDAPTGRWAGIPCGLGALDPLMIVPCHYYEPRHAIYSAANGYRYGMAAKDIAKVTAKQASPAAEAWMIADEFDGLPWNLSGHLAALQVYKSFCLRMGTKAYVGEYGACEPGIRPKEQGAWMRDVNKALDQLGLDRCEFQL